MQSNTFSFAVRVGLAALPAFTCAYALPAAAQTLVSPNFAAAVEGNSNNAFPFHYNQSARYQQVYAASEFSALTGPALITQIAFRPDAGAGAAFSTAFASVQFNLSTTSATVNNLSATFSNNVGADDAVVRSGPVTLSSAFTGPTSGPKDFDVIITLTTPFLYNPASGNLLLDIRKFSSEDIGAQLDSVDANNATSRVVGFNVNSATANLASYNGGETGLVTQFTYDTTPEPGSLALFIGASMTGAGLLARRRRR